MTTFIASLFLAPVVIGVNLLFPVLNGFVLSIMWEWFVVPLGVEPVSLAHAIGITFIMNLLAKSVDKESLKKEDINKSYCRDFCKPILTLLFGWIVTFFI